MFRTVPLSVIGSFSLHTQQWYKSYRFADSLRAGSGWTGVPSWSCSQAVSKPVWHIPLLCVQWIAPDDGRRNCPKHVEFHSKNKFEKLVHLVGSSILILLASCQQTCMTYTIAVCKWKTPDDGQRNCPKHVEFYSKNKFEKLVHLVGSSILILLASCQQTCMTYTIAVCAVKNSWWWTEELSETCRVLFQE